MPRNISCVVFMCGLLALAAMAGGCRRGSTWNLATVEGTVTREGHPLDGIEVIFWADVEAGTQGPRTSAFTDAAGHYELRTDVGDRGAAIGRYRISLVDTRTLPDKLFGPLPEKAANAKHAKEVQEKMRQFQMEASAPPRVPLSYGQPDKTPLRVEVQPGPQVIGFDVKGSNVEVKLLDVPGK
jgi:hypothetical protein